MQSSLQIESRKSGEKGKRDLLRKVLKRKQDDLKSVQKMRRWKKEAQEQLHRDHPNLPKETKVMIMTVKFVISILINVMMMTI